MRKRIFPVLLILILSMLFGGCAKESISEETDSKPSGEAKAVQTLTLHMQLSDEEEAPVQADKIALDLPSGKKLTARVENGVLVVEEVPCEPQIHCVLNSGTSIIAEFTLSFWTGFEIGCHNNLNTLSIDIPGNTADIYLKAQVRKDNKKVTCDFVSQYSFDAQTAPEEDITQVSEEDAAAAGLYGVKYASTTGLNLRAEPSTQSQSVMKLNFGDALSLMNAGEEIDGIVWYKVQYDTNTTGYVSGEFLGKKFTVNKNGVNIRKEPSAESEAVHMVGEGAVVIVMDDGTADGDYKWFRICTRDGLSGYIRNDFLTMA